jgi:hypothetical protein
VVFSEDTNGNNREYRHNFYSEFALHSEHVPVIDTLRIKGSVLLPSPWWNSSPPKDSEIKVRVAIEVPIKGVKRF